MGGWLGGSGGRGREVLSALGRTQRIIFFCMQINLHLKKMKEEIKINKSTQYCLAGALGNVARLARHPLLGMCRVTQVALVNGSPAR